jgi:hypothetical protein
VFDLSSMLWPSVTYHSIVFSDIGGYCVWSLFHVVTICKVSQHCFFLILEVTVFDLSSMLWPSSVTYHSIVFSDIGGYCVWSLFHVVTICNVSQHCFSDIGGHCVWSIFHVVTICNVSQHCFSDIGGYCVWSVFHVVTICNVSQHCFFWYWRVLCLISLPCCDHL